MRSRVSAVLLFALSAAACADDGGRSSMASRTEGTTSTSTTVVTTTSTTVPSTTSTTAPPLPAPAPSSEVRAVLTSTGLVLPVLGSAGPGRWRVMTPCEREGVAGGTPLTGATVVLDPGHGGAETGAVGSNGLVERDLNLAVAQKTKAVLESQGATVVLTRTGDYNLTLKVRSQLALRLQARAFVSIHHNGGADGPSEHPGTETYYQRASADSKRLGGLLFEELRRYFDSFTGSGVQWFSNVDAGAKYRPGSSGDYYGVLRHSAGVPAVLSEALFLSHSDTEAALLARPEVQQGEADAIGRAIRRFLLTQDAGSGFVEPIPRTSPAGPGGSTSGCTDPALG